jgi:purine nucleosidase
MPTVQKVILDTDIGDDIDDALALALICASPELELVGVTTVYGNVEARSRQARTVLSACGKKYRDIPVAAGCGAGICARRLVAGNSRQMYLDKVIPNQDGSCLPVDQLPPLDRRHGVDFLIETIMNGAGDIIPIMIGAMTNLALAMIKEPKILAKIPRIVVMAGEFRSPTAEWNIRCDPEAAAIVFNSGIPIDVTPFIIGITVQFRQEHIDRIAATDRPLAKNLANAIACFQSHGARPDHRPMPSLFDPMAVATMVVPDLVTWKRGTVSVELQGDTTYAMTMFKEKPDGIHRVAWDADQDRSFEYYLSRVLAM